MEAHKNNNKEHLQFDTDFLENVTPKEKPKAEVKSPKAKTDRKAIYWTVGIVVFLIIVGALSDKSGSTSSSNSSSSNSSSNYLQGNGQYSCSSYASSKADSLRPTLTKEAFDAEEKKLEARIAAIKESSTKIDNAQVDENNQYEIDNFNQMVNDHNAELEAIKRDSASYQQRLDQFNSAVDTYNNYLENNCTKRY